MVSVSTETLPFEQQKLHNVSMKSTGTNPREKLPVKSIGVSTEKKVIRALEQMQRSFVSSVGTETIERRTATSGGTFSTPTRDAVQKHVQCIKIQLAHILWRLNAFPGAFAPFP